VVKPLPSHASPLATLPRACEASSMMHQSKRFRPKSGCSPAPAHVVATTFAPSTRAAYSATVHGARAGGFSPAAAALATSAHAAGGSNRADEDEAAPLAGEASPQPRPALSSGEP